MYKAASERRIGTIVSSEIIRAKYLPKPWGKPSAISAMDLAMCSPLSVSQWFADSPAFAS